MLRCLESPIAIIFPIFIELSFPICLNIPHNILDNSASTLEYIVIPFNISFILSHQRKTASYIDYIQFST